MAAANPTGSNVGWFQDAAPIPRAIGISESKAGVEGRALVPSNSKVIRTVMRGIPHFEVYVSEIPILSRATELQKLAQKRKDAGRANAGNKAFVIRIRSRMAENGLPITMPRRSDPAKR